MKVRVNINTGEIVSMGEDKYGDDPIEIIAIDVDELPSSNPAYMYYDGNTIVIKSQAEIDAIVALENEIINRPQAAITAIKTELLSLLNESDADTISRVEGYTAGQRATELGKIEVLLKRIVEIIKPNMKEDVNA